MERKTETIKKQGTPPQAQPAAAPKKKSRARLVVNTFVYLAIIVGIVFGLPKFLSWSLETPYPMAAITSGSMWPVLKEGDLVFIHGVSDSAEIKIGDIVVFRNAENDTLTIHRVVKKLETGKLITKGDANFTEDTPTTFASIVGKTVTVFGKPARIPKLGVITVAASKVANPK